MNKGQYQVLDLARKRHGFKLTQSEVKLITGQSNSTARNNIMALVNKGLINRTRIGTSRNGYNLEITQAGLEEGSPAKLNQLINAAMCKLNTLSYFDNRSAV